ncbi:hypothetical protein [Streptomyces sp. NPDC023588]
MRPDGETRHPHLERDTMSEQTFNAENTAMLLIDHQVGTMG